MSVELEAEYESHSTRILFVYMSQQTSSQMVIIVISHEAWYKVQLVACRHQIYSWSTWHIPNPHVTVDNRSRLYCSFSATLHLDIRRLWCRKEKRGFRLRPLSLWGSMFPRVLWSTVELRIESKTKSVVDTYSYAIKHPQSGNWSAALADLRQHNSGFLE